jgi:hypothetical protein
MKDEQMIKGRSIDSTSSDGIEFYSFIILSIPYCKTPSRLGLLPLNQRTTNASKQVYLKIDENMTKVTWLLTK